MRQHNGKPLTLLKKTQQRLPHSGNREDRHGRGHELVDVRYGKNTYTLEFDLFVKKAYNARLKTMTD